LRVAAEALEGIHTLEGTMNHIEVNDGMMKYFDKYSPTI
jgi:hypothetical protein